MEEKRDGTYIDQFGKEKITPHPTRTAAIVLAAGQGKRMKSKIQKQVSPSGGKAGHLVCTSRV